MPPGGPPDVAAPQIVSIVPDSGTVGVKPKEVVFHFDEVVSERPPSTTSLADLFLISPRDGVPNVSWHRDAITVKPSRGWRPNTPYTVIMRGGLADLRGNVRNTGATTFFSTGSAIPHTRLSGTAFDWVAGRPAIGALVEAFIPPDTLHPYVALVDSSGRFAVEHVPPARYTIRAYIDRNKNLSIDPSEPWDSVSLSVTDSARTELLVFTHDTLPPRIHDVVSVDSLKLRVSFDRPIDPAQTLSAANFAVIGPPPDSAIVPIASAGPAAADTIPRPATPTGPPAATQPGKAARLPKPDSTAPPRPVMSRPSPVSSAVIQLRRPLAPKTSYVIRAIGIRGLLGATGNSEHGFTSAAPPPPPVATPGVKPSPAPATPPASPPPVTK
jgi:hypothetical protein